MAMLNNQRVIDEPPDKLQWSRHPVLPHSRTKTVVQVHRNFHVVLRNGSAAETGVPGLQEKSRTSQSNTDIRVFLLKSILIPMVLNPNFGFDKFGMWLGVQPWSFPSIPCGNIRESSAPASPSWQDVGHLLDWRSRRLDPQSCWDVPRTSVASRPDWWPYPSWNHGYDQPVISRVMLEIAWKFRAKPDLQKQLGQGIATIAASNEAR